MEYNNKERAQIVETVFSRLKRDISGKGVNEISGIPPSKKFFAGCICPKYQSEAAITKGLQNLIPTDMGLEFLIDSHFNKDAKVKVKATGKYFFRVYPTYAEQAEFAKDIEKGRIRLKEKYKSVEFTIQKSITIGNIITSKRGSIDLDSECKS